MIFIAILVGMSSSGAQGQVVGMRKGEVDSDLVEAKVGAGIYWSWGW